MKPLKLSIEGLHSFKERQEVDFEQLSETGLFGIFGKTGSGKSTVLDAVTLALYGSVFRAASRTQGILNSQRDKLEVSFSFAIGPVAQRRIYRIDRGFKRAKDKRDSIQTTVCRLVDLTDGQERMVAESATEVTRKIEEIIGLNMEDFTRSVVLPQGEFSKFLQLKDAERVRMLERIFALSDYGSKLNEKSRQEQKRLGFQLELVECSIREQGAVSETQLTELKTSLAGKTDEQKRIGTELQRVEAEFGAVSQLWQLQSELEEIRAVQAVHLQRQGEIDGKKTMLNRAQQAESLQSCLDGAKRAMADLAGSRENLHQIATRHQAEETENQRLKAEFAKVEVLYFEKQPVLIAKRTEVQQILSMESELRQKELEQAGNSKEQQQLQAQLAQILTQAETALASKTAKEGERNRCEGLIHELSTDAGFKERVLSGVEAQKEVTRLNGEIERIEAEKTGMASQREELEKQLQRESELARHLAGELQTLQERVAGQQEQKPGDLQSYAESCNELSRLETEIHQLIGVRNETEAAKFEVLKLMELWNPAKEKQTELYKAIQQIQHRLAVMEEVQIKLKAEIQLQEEKLLSAKLARELKNGAPCPVCGATHHPKPAELDRSGLEANQAKYEKNENHLKTTQEERDRLNQEFFQIQAQLELFQIRYDELQDKITLLWDKLADSKALLPEEISESSPAELKAYLQQKQQVMENYQKTLGDWEEQLQLLQGQLGQLREAKSEADFKVLQLDGQMAGMVQSLEKLDASLQRLYPERDYKVQELERLRQQLNVTDFLAVQGQIMANERQLEELRQTANRLVADIASLDLIVNTLRSEKEQHTLRFHELKTNEAVLIREMEERRTRIQAVAGTKTAQQLLADINDYLEKLNQKYEYIKDRTEHSRTELQRLENQAAEARTRLEMCEQAETQANQELQRQMAEKGFTTEDELQEAMRSQVECEALKSAIADYETVCQKFQHQIDTLLEKLDGKTVTLEQWKLLKAELDELQQRKEALVAELSKLQTMLADLEQRHQKVKQYLEERSGLETRKSMVDEIVKLLQGDAFVAYIAEEHMRYILWDASRRLEMLTGGRYNLRLDDNKDFAVADNTNGGLARPVSSLSGGETFLVSFSLALALSGKIQLNGRNPLEFFFLDEGFGTLDPQLLEVVMDSLERLRQENMTIGIISHMSELRNRIPRRLIVTPASPDGAGSRVQIEKA